MERKKMPELLSPVRDETSFIAAIQAGADAVYLGLGQLNMRINSRGIDIDKLKGVVKKAHDENVKVYIALNAIVYDDELETLDALTEKIKTAGADAVICSDFAVIEKCNELKIPIHISTQANVSNVQAVRAFAKLGASRVVLARELTLEQIREIKKLSPIEIETFIHGAMCYSVSGRCYMSHFMFDSSANRGGCHQPCRREYTIVDRDSGSELKIGDGYVMSPKDVCTIEIIDQLIDAGIDSFKIEGRSRSPEYIKTTTEVYRIAINAVKDGTFDDKLKAELIKKAQTVYNRGFSTGFYLGISQSQDISDIEGSAATETKVAIGRILNYYSNIGIAYATINSSPVKVGDKIQIHGPTTGVLEFDMTELKDTNGNTITEMEKGKATFPCPQRVRLNDKLFKIVPAEMF
jgi:U32 family peptidase